MAAKKNTHTAWIVTAVTVGMFGLAYAAFPLYNLFCKVTGFGGTTQVALEGAQYKGSRTYEVQFDANVDSSLGWHFVPEQRQITVKTGENTLIFFSAENMGDTPLTGTATFNVTPNKIGGYFNKIECFCFTNQTLNPHQKITLPVSFFIDPEIENDPTAQDVKTITLSYSFFKVKKQ